MADEPENGAAGGNPLERTADMASLSPSERARIYKQRAAAAGIGRAPAEVDAAAPPPTPSPPARPTAEGSASAALTRAAPTPAAAKPAPAPAKPVEPEPDPPAIPALKEIDPSLTWERVHGYVEVKIGRDRLLPVARTARDALGYDYLSAITAVDWEDRFELLYHLYSYDYAQQPGCLVLRIDLEREAYPLVASLTPLWPGADFQEREVYDLMGIKFAGHPDLRRILLDDDFPGHPLRKDFEFDYQYVLVHHLSYGADQQNVTRMSGPTSEYESV